LSKIQKTTNTREQSFTRTTTVITSTFHESHRIRKVKKAGLLNKSPNCLTNYINITYNAFKSIDFNEKIDDRFDLTQINSKIYLQINVSPTKDSYKLVIPQKYHRIHLILDEFYLITRYSNLNSTNQSFIHHG
jgi:hypothetical protein